MDKLPFYYLVLCVDGFRDYMISRNRIGPGCCNGTPPEIPDSMSGLHRVFGVYPALRQNYDAHQAKLAQKVGRA